MVGVVVWSPALVFALAASFSSGNEKVVGIVAHRRVVRTYVWRWGRGCNLGRGGEHGIWGVGGS
ncbi:hypothetical protein GCM10027184_43780 [Saccharothrix stipae]